MAMMSKEAEQAMLNMYNLLGGQKPLPKKEAVDQLFPEHGAFVLTLIRKKDATQSLVIPPDATTKDVIHLAQMMIEHRYPKIATTFSPQEAERGNKYQISKYLLLLFYELTITQNETVLAQLISRLDNEGTGNNSAIFTHMIKTLTKRIEDLDEECWEEIFYSCDDNEEMVTTLRPSSPFPVIKGTPQVARFTFRTPKASATITNSASSPALSDGSNSLIQDFVSSPLLREKRMAREKDELRKRMHELEELVNERELQKRAMDLELNDAQKKVKIHRDKNEELQKDLLFKDELLVKLEQEVSNLSRRLENSELEASSTKSTLSNTLRMLEEHGNTIKGLESDKENYAFHMKESKQKIRDLTSETEEVLRRFHSMEKRADDFQRLLEEKKVELKELAMNQERNRISKQNEFDEKEQIWIEERRHLEDLLHQQSEKLEVAEKMNLDQLRAHEMEKERELALRVSYQEQIKKLEEFNQQLRQIRSTAEDKEASEKDMLARENVSLRRQIIEMQTRDHTLQNQLLDCQSALEDMKKDNAKLDAQCAKLESWNSELKTYMERTLEVDKQNRLSRAAVEGLEQSMDRLTQENDMLKLKFSEEERKSYDAFLEVSRLNNKVESLEAEAKRNADRLKELEAELQETRPLVQRANEVNEKLLESDRKLKDLRFTSSEYIEDLKLKHKAEIEALRKELQVLQTAKESCRNLDESLPPIIETSRKPLGESRRQNFNADIENEEEPRSKATTQIRSRASIGSGGLVSSLSQREINWNQTARASELAQRNKQNLPHLRGHYAVEPFSPRSQSLLDTEVPLTEITRTPY